MLSAHRCTEQRNSNGPLLVPPCCRPGHHQAPHRAPCRLTWAGTMRPVLNITHRAPGAKPTKFARVTFPESVRPLDVAATMRRIREEDGYQCDLRQHGPHGFSLPLDRAAYFAPATN